MRFTKLLFSLLPTVEPWVVPGENVMNPGDVENVNPLDTLSSDLHEWGGRVCFLPQHFARFVCGQCPCSWQLPFCVCAFASRATPSAYCGFRSAERQWLWASWQLWRVCSGCRVVFPFRPLYAAKWCGFLKCGVSRAHSSRVW